MTRCLKPYNFFFNWTLHMGLIKYILNGKNSDIKTN